MDGPALCHASVPRRLQADAVPVSLESFTPVDIGATTKEDLSAEGGTCAARHTSSPPPLSPPQAGRGAIGRLTAGHRPRLE